MEILVINMFLNFLNCSLDKNIFKVFNIYLLNNFFYVQEKTELIFFNVFKEGLLVDYLQKKLVDLLIKSLFIKTTQVFNYTYMNNIVSFYLINFITDFVFFLKNYSSSVADVFFVICFFVLWLFNSVILSYLIFYL